MPPWTFLTVRLVRSSTEEGLSKLTGCLHKMLLSLICQERLEQFSSLQPSTSTTAWVSLILYTCNCYSERLFRLYNYSSIVDNIASTRFISILLKRGTSCSTWQYCSISISINYNVKHLPVKLLWSLIKENKHELPGISRPLNGWSSVPVPIVPVKLLDEWWTLAQMLHTEVVLFPDRLHNSNLQWLNVSKFSFTPKYNKCLLQKPQHVSVLHIADRVEHGPFSSWGH